MKSMTKLMVVAMLLVAALVVAPAAAQRDDTVSLKGGEIIYVGEDNLNFSGLLNTKDGWLVHYSDPSTGTADKPISISDNTSFDLTEARVGSFTGAFYVVNSSVPGGYNQPPVTAGFPYVNIEKPNLALDVVLNKTIAGGHPDSVNGKSVTKSEVLDFELQNNLDGLLGPNLKVNIDVATPGGGTVRYFGGQDLGNVVITKTKQYTSGIKLDGVEAGAYTAQAKWPSTSDFYNKGFNSNTVTFEVLSKKLAISANKDSVVRGNSFAVTVTGESKTDYIFFVKEVSGLTENQYPLIAPGQPDVTIGNVTAGMTLNGKTVTKDDLKSVPPFKYTNATIKTDAGGKREVKFNTTGKTDDKQFTIRVQDAKDRNTYDEVKVRIQEGEVTVTASGTGVYYIGEEITLSGTCTDNKDFVYLFLTGPNLGTDGVKLDDLAIDAENGNKPNTFKQVEVEVDDTWSYKWDTSNLNKTIDAGGYTVYAVSQPVNKVKLSEAKYDTVSVQLKSAFITATTSGAVVAKGDDLKITGTAQGNPAEGVHVWIFGKNLQKLHESATVESDGSFEYKLDNTKDLSAGQYFVVIQHPMSNGFGVVAVGNELRGQGATSMGVTPVDLSKLQASDAATAVINALDSPNVDDTYVKLTFVVEEPNIFIDPIGDKEAGSKFTISGTTNAAVGDKLIVDVTSAAFQPSKKTETSGFASASGTATVEKGDGVNKWSFEVDATGFKPDQYIVKVECLETDTTQTATFNVVEAKPTTQPTGAATTQPTGTATTATTTAPATTPTQSPGFGALVALAGLGAVAFLVLRRN